MSDGLVEDMDRKAKVLQQRLFYWALVVGGAPATVLGWLVPLERYPSTDSTELDSGAMALAQLLLGFGAILLLGAVILRRKSQRSWIIPGLFLALGLFQLIQIELLPDELITQPLHQLVDWRSGSRPSTP